VGIALFANSTSTTQTFEGQPQLSDSTKQAIQKLEQERDSTVVTFNKEGRVIEEFQILDDEEPQIRSFSELILRVNTDLKRLKIESESPIGLTKRSASILRTPEENVIQLGKELQGEHDTLQQKPESCGRASVRTRTLRRSVLPALIQNRLTR
jgi:hypothetical protein